MSCSSFCRQKMSLQTEKWSLLYTD